MKWPFWFFPNIRKKNRIKNKTSKQNIHLITRRKHPPPPNTHLTWSHYSSHHSWPGRGNEGGPKGSSGVAWQCAQTCCMLSVCYKALWVINSNQRNPFPVCNLIGLPQLLTNELKHTHTYTHTHTHTHTHKHTHAQTHKHTHTDFNNSFLQHYCY